MARYTGTAVQQGRDGPDWQRRDRKRGKGGKKGEARRFNEPPQNKHSPATNHSRETAACNTITTVCGVVLCTSLQQGPALQQGIRTYTEQTGAQQQ